MICSALELIGTVALAVSCRAPAPAVVVHTTAHTLTVYAEGAATTVPVGIGRPGWETPHGSFTLAGAFAPPSPAYGPAVVLTTARGRVTDEFSGTIAIHGTDQPELIPGNPSHGCVRIKNPDLVRSGVMDLPRGTPLVIVS